MILEMFLNSAVTSLQRNIFEKIYFYIFNLVFSSIIKNKK